MRFIRHGQSVFNERLSLLGRDPQTPDAPLTPLGEKQVAASAQRFGGKIGLIISSPYTRALQTAAIFASVHPAPIVVDSLAGEQRLYSCDIGSAPSALEAVWAGLDFSELMESWWLPFPESKATFLRRLEAFKDRWAFDERERQTLVVSHWHFINAMTGADPANAEIVEGA